MVARKKKILIVLCIGVMVLTWRVSVLVTKYLPSDARAALTGMLTDGDGTQGMPNGYYSDGAIAKILAQQETAARGPWGRDPFTHIADVHQELDPVRIRSMDTHLGPRPKAPLLGFTGVSKSNGQWLAVVRGNIVQIGDVIDGEYRVKRIARGSITLAARGWILRYELGSETAVVRPLSEGP